MNKRWITIGFAGAFLLGAVGYALTQQLPFSDAVQAQTSAKGEERVMVVAVEENINGEIFAGEVRIRHEDPETLPERAADASGLFLDRNDSELTLSTGAIEVEAGIEAKNDEEPVTTINASHRGVEVTIMVDDDTRFYRDTTKHPKISPADIEAGEMVLERTIEAGSVDEIGENMLLRAWGTERNGTLVADLLVYEPIR